MKTDQMKKPRVSIPTLDDQIGIALAERPDWLEGVYARLAGHPAPDACWEWTGGKHDRGYGKVRLPVPTKGVAAVHRVVWLAVRGPIPAGWVLDHDGDGCGNRSCANPDHVACVPEKVNVHTGNSPWGANARKTHCPRGHELVAGNLTASSVKRGGRSCLKCHSARSNA